MIRRPLLRPVLRPVLGALLAAATAAGCAANGGPAAGRAGSAPQPADGWYLTVVEHGTPAEFGLHVRRETLDLVGPAGERTHVLARRLGPHQRGYFSLADWSADGSRALLLVDPGNAAEHALVVDVPSGSVRRVPLGGSVESVLLGGDGTLLAEGYGHGDQGAALWRIAPDGDRTRLAARLDGPLLPSSDGSTIVTGTRSWKGHALRVLDRDGHLVQRVATHAHCTPVRWWAASTVEVRCARGSSMTLSLVDLSSRTETRLTRPHGRHSADLGDIDARRVAGGLFLQASGPCGYVFLARQHDDGSVSKVRVPHAVGNVLLVGADGDRLVLEHAASCDGSRPRPVLARFDPADRQEEPIVELDRHAAFGAVLPYGERPASSY